MKQKFLKKYRYSLILLRELVITDFKLRYQGSALGYIWSLLRPLALFAILYVVFVKFLPVGKGIPHYPVYLLLGIVVWNYFTEVSNNGVGAIVGRGDLIRKLNFPKYVIVLAGSFSALINLALNLVVVVIFAVASGVEVSIGSLWAPLLLVELFVFSLSVAFLLSALFVKLRDINYIWEVLMQGAFYGTPIIYPINSIPVIAQKVLILTPPAQIMQDLRQAFIWPQAATVGTIYGTEWARLIPVAFVAVFAVFSMLYFRRHAKNFAEEV
ncbi:MAG: transporter [Candidatus Saccharibacteria bacterium]|nr:transporter [Candidatus Saccharibacteria bacterium]